MPTLFEQVSQRLQDTPAPTVEPNRQEQAQKILQAKTGKAGGPQTFKASSLGQQSVLDQAKELKKEQKITGALQAEELKTQEQQLQQQEQQTKSQQDLAADLQQQERFTRDILAQQGIRGAEDLATAKLTSSERMKMESVNAKSRQTLRALAADRESTMEDVFATFQQSQKELEFRRDASALEQLGFNLSLQDQQYTATVDRMGRRRMLKDDIQWREEMELMRLGDNFSQVMDELAFRESFNADRREWEEELSKIDINAALDLAMAAIEDENNRMLWTGIGEAGAAAAKYGDFDFSSEATDTSEISVGSDRTAAYDDNSGGEWTP